MEYNPQFWQALDQLLARSALVIDRPKGSSHPRFPEMVYPLDYGYLENTASMDGEGVDVWVARPSRRCWTASSGWWTCPRATWR